MLLCITALAHSYHFAGQHTAMDDIQARQERSFIIIFTIISIYRAHWISGGGDLEIQTEMARITSEVTGSLVLCMN